MATRICYPNPLLPPQMSPPGASPRSPAGSTPGSPIRSSPVVLPQSPIALELPPVTPDFSNNENIIKIKKLAKEKLKLIDFFKNISPSLKNNKAFIIEAVKVDQGCLLPFTNFVDDREVVKAAVQANPFILEHAHDTLKRDLEIVGLAVKTFPRAIKCTPFKYNKSAVTQLLALPQQNGAFFEFIADSLKKDKKFVKVNHNVFKFLTHDKQNNEEFVLDCISLNHMVYEFIKDEFKNDKSFIKAAINKNVKVFEFIKSDFQIDREIAMLAARKDPELLKNNDWLKDRVFVEELLEKNPQAFKWIDPNLRKDLDLALLAVSKGYARAVNHFLCNPSLMKDNIKYQEMIRMAVFNGYAKALWNSNLNDRREFVISLLPKTPEAFEFFHDNLKNDPEIVIRAVKYNYELIQYSQLKWDRGFVLKLLAIAPDVIEFIPTSVLLPLDMCEAYNKGLAAQGRQDPNTVVSPNRMTNSSASPAAPLSAVSRSSIGSSTAPITPNLLTSPTASTSPIFRSYLNTPRPAISRNQDSRNQENGNVMNDLKNLMKPQP